MDPRVLEFEVDAAASGTPGRPACPRPFCGRAGKRPGLQRAGGRCGGQAIIEFVVGLIAVLVLLVALVQLVSLSVQQNESLVEARRDAGERAMLQLAPGMDIVTSPEFIGDWSEGGDLKRYTPDDLTSHGNAPGFDSEIVGRSVADESGWNIVADSPNNRVGTLHGNMAPETRFGLVDGSDERDVPLISAVQSFLYKADSLRIRSVVWMTWTSGIY